MHRLINKYMEFVSLVGKEVLEIAFWSAVVILVLYFVQRAW